MVRLETIIFDVDGCIMDSANLIIQSIKNVFRAHNLPIPSDSRIEELRALKASKALAALEIPLLLKSLLFLETWEEFYKRRDQIKPYQNMAEIVNELSRESEVLVLSSNRRSLLQPLFHKYGIKCNGLYHSNKLFGKQDELIQIIKERNGERERERFLYLGDEVRDVEACTAAGIRIYPVTWGLNNEKAFIEAGINPEDIVREPNEILPKIRKLKYAT